MIDCLYGSYNGIYIYSVQKSANREESLITSKVSVSESFTTPSLTEPPALEISAPIAVDLQHGVAAALLNDAVNQSSTKEDGDALMTTNLSSQEVPDRIRHEEAATKAQAAFRGYLVNIFLHVIVKLLYENKI